MMMIMMIFCASLKIGLKRFNINPDPQNISSKQILEQFLIGYQKG
jgi:hypothetical protein